MSEKFPFDSSPLPSANAAERRAAAQRMQEERAAERRLALDSQAAPHTAPQDRIRIWERLHALRLPTAKSHPLLWVIARQTGLTLHEVTEEQHRRVAEHVRPREGAL